MDPSHHDVSSSYPVLLEVEPVARFERVQLLLRLLVLVAIGILHQSLGGLFTALYFFLPIVVAILISRKGGADFLAQDTRWIVPVLEWVVGFYAYLLFVSDRFPLDTQKRAVRLRIHFGGAPTVGSALSRLIKSLPHAFVLAVLGFVSAWVWLLAAVMILFTERYPDALLTFQRGIVAWTARVFAYHGSLVEAYPPFSLAARDETPPQPIAGAGYLPPA